MALLHQAYLHPSVRQALPSEVKFAEDKVSAEMAFPAYFPNRLQPQGATTFSPSNRNISFRIQADGDKMLAGQTSYLRFRHKCTDASSAANNWAYLQDGAVSLFRNLNVSFGGYQLPITRQYALIHHCMMYFTSSMEYLRQQGLASGYYMDLIANDNTASAMTYGTVANAGNLGDAYVQASDTNALTNSLAVVAEATGVQGAPATSTIAGASAGANNVYGLPIVKNPASSNAIQVNAVDPLLDRKNAGINGRYYNVPLSLLGFCRTNKFIPLSLLGYIQIDIELNDFQECHVWGSAYTTQSYVVDDVYLHYRLLQPAPEIAEQLRVLARESDAGLAMAFEGFDSQNFPLTMSSSVVPRIQLNKSKVKSVFAISRNQSLIRDSSTMSLSQYEYDKVKSYQFQKAGMPLTPWRVGETSEYNSTLKIWGVNDMNIELQQAFNQYQDHNTGSIVELDNYTGAITRGNVTLPPRFVIGIDLETIDGQLTGANFKAGEPQLTLDIVTDNATGDRIYTFIYQYDYVVVIRGGAVSASD